MQPNVNPQMTMTDQDQLTDLLTQEKHMIGTYSAMVAEASCPNLRGVLTNNMSDTVADQYQVFSQMRQRGWYPGKDAPTPEVDAAKQKFTQMKQQMGR